MFQRIHEKLGTAGFIVSIIALIAALSGGAYAASGGLNGKQKKEVETIAKSFAGKRGPAGKQGPAGPTGPAGPAGAKGDNGAKGDTGPKGDTGATGAQGSQGPQGKQGVQGSAGDPWTAGGTLPPGETETGSWSIFFSSTVETFPGALGSISFPIPLATAGLKAFVFTAEETELEEFGTSGCAGTLEAPTAPPGVLCVYSDGPETEEHTSGSLEARQMNGEETGFSKSGALLTGIFIQGTAAEPAFYDARGSWAVTAPTP